MLATLRSGRTISGGDETGRATRNGNLSCGRHRGMPPGDRGSGPCRAFRTRRASRGCETRHPIDVPMAILYIAIITGRETLRRPPGLSVMPKSGCAPPDGSSQRSSRRWSIGFAKS